MILFFPAGRSGSLMFISRLPQSVKGVNSTALIHLFMAGGEIRHARLGRQETERIRHGVPALKEGGNG